MMDYRELIEILRDERNGNGLLPKQIVFEEIRKMLEVIK